MFGRKSKDDQDSKNVRVATVETLEEEIQAFDLKLSPTSTIFTANELYLIEKGGYEVIQVVFGNVVYSMGIRGVMRSITRALTRGEMPEFTQMNNDARIIARNRMLEQAKQLDATAVVGVTIEATEFADFLEVTATGTAIRKVGKASDVDISVAV